MSTLPPGPPSGWTPDPAPTAPQGRPPAAATGGRTPGRGLVIAGSVLIAVAVLGGFVGVQVAVSRLDVESLQRDVVVEGPRQVIVPGRIPFEVQEPLSSGTRSAMTVGIGVDSRSGPDPSCSLATAAGETVGGPPVFGTELLDQGASRFEVTVAARLDPGDYVAECRGPSEGTVVDSEFTVGRVLGEDDVRGLLGPVLTALGAGALAVVVLLVGVILLIVGLVRRNRANRPPGPPGPPGWGPPSGGQPWDAQQWGGPHQTGPQQWGGPPQTGPQQWGGPPQPGSPPGPQQWGGPPPAPPGPPTG